MFIRINHHVTDSILVLNIDIESYKDFYAKGSSLVFTKYTMTPQLNEDGYKVLDEYEDEIMIYETDVLPFKSDKEAEDARDALFTTLATNSPFNKVLDLTIPFVEVVIEEKKTDEVVE